jgi:uncharacterized membrane protein YedE/YeeE
MKVFIVSLLSGIIFAFGLVISGMTNPDKVIGFLDILGQWNPSLIFVMVGAILFNFISFKILLKKEAPLCAQKYHLPENKSIDKKLLIGSSLFGIGWGILGICPGPGIVNLVTFNPSTLLFVLSMIVGMFLFKLTEKYWSSK